MREPRLIVIGGGLAGLSTGCYALANGFSVTIIEHNLELGGVCTAWRRGPYLVDGCIHWLTSGPFRHFYEELGILPTVKLRTLDEFATLIIDGIHPLVVGDHENEYLYLRIYNEDHAFAPP